MLSIKNKSSFLKFLAIISVVIFIVLFISSCNQDNNNKIVAKVNNENITQSQLNEELNKQYGYETLQNLINQVLVLQEAKKKNITVSDKEIEEEIYKTALNMGGIENLRDQLKSRNINFNDYKQKVKLDLLLRKLVISELTEDELKVFYDNIKNSLPMVEVSFIMVPDKDLANSIIENLKKGASFEKLSETYSQDPLTKDTKGYAGFLLKNDISNASPTFKSLDEAIFKAPKKGEIIGPIEVNYKNQKLYYIVKYLNVLKSYEEVKPKLQEILAQQKSNEYIQKLRKNSNIEILYNKNNK
ncbi:MAG: foldase protein PrsA [bacterium]|jgi:foldase protein PrsA